MTTRNDRYAPPGAEPTDEDLRHEVELTRQELGQTVASLMSTMDVRARARAKLREVRQHPVVLGGIAAALAALVVLWVRR